MAIEIQCPGCMDDPQWRERCVMCAGKGIIVDTGAPPGSEAYARGGPPTGTFAHPSLLERIPALVAGSGAGPYLVAANDGTLWAGGPLSDTTQWHWVRLPDLPQGQQDAT